MTLTLLEVLGKPARAEGTSAGGREKKTDAMKKSGVMSESGSGEVAHLVASIWQTGAGRRPGGRP